MLKGGHRGRRRKACLKERRKALSAGNEKSNLDQVRRELGFAPEKNLFGGPGVTRTTRRLRRGISCFLRKGSPSFRVFKLPEERREEMRVYMTRRKLTTTYARGKDAYASLLPRERVMTRLESDRCKYSPLSGN